MKQRDNRRILRGMTLIEMTVTLGVLAMLLALVGQWVTFSLAQQQLSEQQRFALETAANVLEQASSQPWNKLTNEQLQPLAEKATQELGAEQWQVAIEVSAAPAEKELPPLQTRMVHVMVEHRTNALLRAELSMPRQQLTEATP